MKDREQRDHVEDDSIEEIKMMEYGIRWVEKIQINIWPNGFISIFVCTPKPCRIGRRTFFMIMQKHMHWKIKLCLFHSKKDLCKKKYV